MSSADVSENTLQRSSAQDQDYILHMQASKDYLEKEIQFLKTMNQSNRKEMLEVKGKLDMAQGEKQKMLIDYERCQE